MPVMPPAPVPRRTRVITGIALSGFAVLFYFGPLDQVSVAERQFASRMGATTVEIASGHVAMVSHPDAVADLIRQAVAASLAV